MHQTEPEMTVMLEGGGTSVRSLPCAGMLASILEIPAGADFTPALVGLPQDMCPSPHWGYMLEGSLHLRYADGTEETTKAGEAFYWPAFHTAWTTEKVRFFELSPEKEMTQLLDHLKSQG